METRRNPQVGVADDDVETLLRHVADRVELRRERDRIAMEVRAADLAAREERIDALAGRIRELEQALLAARSPTPTIDVVRAGARRRLGKQLVAEGVLEKPVVRSALLEQKRTGDRLGAILLDRGDLSPRVLLQALARQNGVPPVGPRDRGVGGLSAEAALEYRAVALAVEGINGHVGPGAGRAATALAAVAVRDLAGAVAVSEALGRVIDIRIADAPTMVRLFAEAYGPAVPVPALAPLAPVPSVLAPVPSPLADVRTNGADPAAPLRV